MVGGEQLLGLVELPTLHERVGEVGQIPRAQDVGAGGVGLVERQAGVGLRIPELPLAVVDYAAQAQGARGIGERAPALGFFDGPVEDRLGGGQAIAQGQGHGRHEQGDADVPVVQAQAPSENALGDRGGSVGRSIRVGEVDGNDRLDDRCRGHLARERLRSCLRETIGEVVPG